jgi:membrane-anchored protein YejM (alkaline phosphatase superfamily)
MGSGNLVLEWMIWLVAGLVGGAAACWWQARVFRRSEQTAAIGAVGLLGLGMVGVTHGPPAVFFTGLVLALGLLRWPSGDSREQPQARNWLRQRGDFNAVYFWMFILINTACDAALTRGLPGGMGEGVWFVTGRFFTYLTLTAGLWFVIRSHGRWAPRGAGVVGWLAVVVIPVLGILDSTMRLLWSKGLTSLFRELQVSDWADLRHMLKGGEVRITGGHMMVIAGLLLGFGMVFVVAGRLSRRRRWHVSPRRHLVVAVAAWLLLAVQQVFGLWWMPRETWMWQRRTCLLHLSPLSAPNGCASFDVAWHLDPVESRAGLKTKPAPDPVPVAAGAPPASSERPDVYLFIVETLRADGLQPAVTPFLSRWQAEECQRIRVAYSGSNATHLSWFAIFHGLPATVWKENHGIPQTSPVLKAAHDAGYQVEVRGAGTFDYVDMRTGNFGDGSDLAVLDYPKTTDSGYLDGISAREVRMIESVRKSVAASAPGTAFHVITLDSPHYPYKWGRDWTPPFPDYDPNPMFPVNPSASDVARIKTRYQNSLAWVDGRIADFVANLRRLGRYDNALIIFTGDHGEEFQEHGFWFHASALSPEQTTVPLLVKWPAKSGRGPDRAQASHLDIAPTMLEAIGCPESEWRHLPGRSLSQSDTGTVMVATRCASRDGEAMHWRRDGWQAAFSWSRTWTPEVPHRLWLERLNGPDGPVFLDSPAAYERELRARFPDVFPRFFSRFQLAEDP